MKTKPELLVIDLDGTALGGCEPYERFPDRLSTLLDEITSRGMLWATCTTWHPCLQDGVFRASRLKSRPARVIGSGGMSCGLYRGKDLYLDAWWDLEMLGEKSMTKGKAVRRIQAQLGITPAGTIVAGDGLNDLSMMRKSLARYQVAPSNAEPRVRERVLQNGGIVSALPYSEGVVEAVRRIAGA